MLLRIDLETANFCQHWTYIFMNEFAYSKPMIQITISEHHISPEVEALANRFVQLFAALVLGYYRIKATLRDLYEVRL